MADLKEKMRGNAKYLFWAGTGLAAVVALVCWFLSTKTLSEQYNKGKSEILASFEKPGKVTAITNHPNQGTIDTWQDANVKRKVSVKKAWEKIYADQSQFFKWPKDRLPKEFRDEIATYAVPDLTKIPKVEIRNDLREQFNQKYIRNEFERLVKLVDAEWYKERANAAPVNPGRGPLRGANAGGVQGLSGGASQVGGAGAAPADPDEKPKREYKVEWNEQNQSQIHHTFEWTEAPSTLRILYAQEDLWIYERLCKTIAKMNEGAKGKHDATIWAITSLDIAQAAANNSFESRIERPKSAGGGFFAGGAASKATSEDAVSPDPAAPPPKRVRGGGEGGGGAEFNPNADAGATDDSLQDGRYVDLDGSPIMHTDLQGTPTDDKKFYGQFRMMPFRLQLIMDQRKIMPLLIELRNSTLPLEIRQVRLNPQGKNGDLMQEAHRFGLHAMPIEIRGAFFLYNPLDESLLKTENPAAAPAEVAKPGDTAPADAGTPAPPPDTKPEPVEPTPVEPAPESK